jgi:hypothetical protein
MIWNNMGFLFSERVAYTSSKKEIQVKFFPTSR